MGSLPTPHWSDPSVSGLLVLRTKNKCAFRREALGPRDLKMSNLRDRCFAVAVAFRWRDDLGVWGAGRINPV